MKTSDLFSSITPSSGRRSTLGKRLSPEVAEAKAPPIVVAIDMSAESKRALALAAGLAAQRQSRLFLLHVVASWTYPVHLGRQPADVTLMPLSVREQLETWAFELIEPSVLARTALSVRSIPLAEAGSVAAALGADLLNPEPEKGAWMRRGAERIAGSRGWNVLKMSLPQGAVSCGNS